MPEAKPRPQIAFVAAALALLVTPVLVMFGLTALGFVAAMLARLDGAMGGDAGWIFIAAFVLWVVLVVSAVLLLVSRLLRRTTRA